MLAINGSLWTRTAVDVSAHRRQVARRPTGRWARFVARWGWRAYALPALTVLTVAALVHDVPAHHAVPVAAPARAAASTPLVTNRAGDLSPVGSATGTGGVAGFADLDVSPPGWPQAAPAHLSLGDDAVSCAVNHYRKLVLVSIRRQHLWACDGAREVASTAVTTGKVVDHDQTPLGSWRVQGKQRNRYLVGPGYRDYVHYWVPFNGDFGLHDAPWQTMPFGSSHWPTRGSHGCVHVPTTTMARLYRWARVGQTVVTIES
jgi:hypothetical protein